MKKWILVFGSMCSLAILTSCAPQEEIIQNQNQTSDFYCSNYHSKNYSYLEEERPYRRETRIELSYVIKDGDTLDIKELICVDSMNFTQELGQFKVSDVCVEMGIQGNTYFIAKTNKYGGFEEVSVARSVDPCFHDLEEKIKGKVLSMRIVPEHAGTYEVVFLHYFRLH